MKIVRVKQLSGTEHMAFAIFANSEMVRAGQSSPRVCGISWEHRAIVALGDDDTPIGIITFAKVDWTLSLHVALGFVHPLKRRQGIYQAMWSELVAWAQDDEIPLITGTIYCDNQPMLTLAKKLGRVEKAVTVEFEVPTKAE